MSTAPPIAVVARVQSEVNHYVDTALREEQAQPFFSRRTVHLIALGCSMIAIGAYLLTQRDELSEGGFILACILPVMGLVFPFSRKQLLQSEFKTKKMRTEPLTLEFTPVGFLATTPTRQQQREWNRVGETVEFADGVLLRHGESATWVPSKGFATASALQQFVKLARDSVKNHRSLQPLEQYVGAGPDHVPVEVTEAPQAMAQRFDEAAQDAIVAVLRTNLDYWVKGEQQFVHQDLQHRLQKYGKRFKLAMFSFIAWILATTVIAIGVLQADSMGIAAVIGALLVAAVVAGGVMLVSAWDLAQLRKKFANASSGDLTCEFTREGYRISGTGGPWLARWGSVLKVVEMRDGWIMLSDGGDYRWLPADSLESPEDVVDLQQLLKSSVIKYTVFSKLRY